LSARLRIAIVIAVATVAGSVIVALVLRAALDDDDGVAQVQPGTSLASALAGASAAESPFTGFTAARVGVEDRCLRVVVADELDERVQGLRGVAATDPYDGMLFVFDGDTESRFTMAGTLVALDIVWYDSEGAPVGATTMVPCAGTDAGCPTYGPDRPYRYALETGAGSGVSGVLGACPG